MSQQRNPACLHCCLNFAIEAFYKHHGERTEGRVLVDASEVIAKLAEVIGDFVQNAETRPQRRQFQKYARDCLDAAFKAAATGEVVPVQVGPLEHEH